MCSIAYANSESAVAVDGSCATWSFLCRRYSQWKKRIKQTTRITEKTANMYTGTKIKRKIQNDGF